MFKATMYVLKTHAHSRLGITTITSIAVGKIICEYIADLIKRPSSEGRAVISNSLVNLRSLRRSDQTNESAHYRRMQRHRHGANSFGRRQTRRAGTSIHAKAGSGAANSGTAGVFAADINKTGSRAANPDATETTSSGTANIGAKVDDNLFHGDPLLLLAQ